MNPQLLFALALASVADAGLAGLNTGQLYADLLAAWPEARPSTAVGLRNVLLDLGAAEEHPAWGRTVIVITPQGRAIAERLRELLEAL